jgi:predicted nucleic acid-binding protein
MPNYFFDTSALGKNYHSEVGTPRVEQLLREPSIRHFISRLSVIEIQSVFASKVRTGVISESDFGTLRRRFLTDVAKRRLDVVRLSGFHYQEAERLIRTHAMSYSLRTLDAIQLSVALDLRARGLSNYFVCADRNLCKVAIAEALTVINPEIP